MHLQELLHNCKKGDRASQKTLYLAHVDRLKAIAWRYFQSVQDTQDVVQSAYLKIFKNIDQYKHTAGTFESWTNRIIINECLQLIRKRKTAMDFSKDLQVVTETSDYNWSRFTLDEIETVLKHLNGSQRALINMYFFEGFNYSEIADHLQVKESSVRSSLSRAKARLIEIWTSYNKIANGYE